MCVACVRAVRVGLSCAHALPSASVRAWEAEATEVLAGGCEHEQDLQVALHHAAVLQPPQLCHL